MHRDRPPSGWPAAVLATAVAGAGFLPWAASGAASRSGYALARVLRDAGLADGGVAGTVTAGVLALPLFASLAWVGTFLARPAVAASGAVAAGGLAVAAGVLVTRSSGVDAELGAAIGSALGFLALVAAAHLGWQWVSWRKVRS